MFDLWLFGTPKVDLVVTDGVAETLKDLLQHLFLLMYFGIVTRNQFHPADKHGVLEQMASLAHKIVAQQLHFRPHRRFFSYSCEC